VGRADLPSDPQLMGKNAYAACTTSTSPRSTSVARRQCTSSRWAAARAGRALICSKIIPSAPTKRWTCSRRHNSCKRKFVPELNGRLVATCGDATSSPSRTLRRLRGGQRDHVTEMPAAPPEEDERFFRRRSACLSRAGSWCGHAIPTHLEALLRPLGPSASNDRELRRDQGSVKARDEDKARIDPRGQLIKTFHASRSHAGRQASRPGRGRAEELLAQSGTKLYDNMVTHRTYKVSMFQKPSPSSVTGSPRLSCVRGEACFFGFPPAKPKRGKSPRKDCGAGAVCALHHPLEMTPFLWILLVGGDERHRLVGSVTLG